jgi:hypothetical protein
MRTKEIKGQKKNNLRRGGRMSFVGLSETGK